MHVDEVIRSLHAVTYGRRRLPHCRDAAVLRLKWVSRRGKPTPSIDTPKTTGDDPPASADVWLNRVVLNDEVGLQPVVEAQGIGESELEHPVSVGLTAAGWICEGTNSTPILNGLETNTQAPRRTHAGLTRS